MVVLGFVKWFSTNKGFGFIQSDAVNGDIFFHITQLHRIGGLIANSGDKIVCKISLTDTQVYKAERVFYFKSEQRNLIHLDVEVEKLILNNTIEIFKQTRNPSRELTNEI
jgi:cold shock CspA family protein